RDGHVTGVQTCALPIFTWPNGARLALWIIPNVETFALNEPVPGGTGLAPDVINWAPRDYGNRVGIFRMMEVMARHGVRGTVALRSEERRVGKGCRSARG